MELGEHLKYLHYLKPIIAHHSDCLLLLNLKWVLITKFPDKYLVFSENRTPGK